MKELLVLIPLLAATPASAEVASASSNGFVVRQSVNFVVSPEVTFRAFQNVAGWWDPEHTYSGDSTNLSLNLTPGGCFCERTPKVGGGVEHMRVAFIEPGKHVVLIGSLGPLLYEATTGVMDVEIKGTGGGSQLTMTYKVAGFAAGGADKLAPLVDAVLATQMKRLRAYATSRPRS